MTAVVTFALMRAGKQIDCFPGQQVRIHVKIFVLALLALTALSVPVDAAAHCPLLKAVYAPVDADNDMSASAGEHNSYRARHVAGHREFNQASYVLRITEERQKIHYNFGFAYPSGYGGIALIFLGSNLPRSPYRRKPTDPESSIFYFGKDLKPVTPGENPEVAPAMLIMPELGSSFWYWVPGNRTFVPPAGMWTRISCDR
jgi:hypothetical protein